MTNQPTQEIAAKAQEAAKAGAAWFCMECGAFNASPSMRFPMMHAHANVEPMGPAVVAWGRALGAC